MDEEEPEPEAAGKLEGWVMVIGDSNQVGYFHMAGACLRRSAPIGANGIQLGEHEWARYEARSSGK